MGKARRRLCLFCGNGPGKESIAKLTKKNVVYVMGAQPAWHELHERIRADGLVLECKNALPTAALALHTPGNAIYGHVNCHKEYGNPRSLKRFRAAVKKACASRSSIPVSKDLSSPLRSQSARNSTATSPSSASLRGNVAKHDPKLCIVCQRERREAPAAKYHSKVRRGGLQLWMYAWEGPALSLHMSPWSSNLCATAPLAALCHAKLPRARVPDRCV